MTQAESYRDCMETEEFISAREYQERRERGEIDAQKTRIVPPDFGNNRDGGFMVQLSAPHYRIPEFPPLGGRHGK